MSEVFGCLLNPAGCIDGAVTSWLAWFPFGIVGVAFMAGLIIGAARGKWGVGALLALAVALKVASKGEPIEHVTGKDALPPVPKRPTIFKRKK